MMKIRYKVVKVRTRYSAIVNGNSKYALRYTRGSVVKAPEGTMGIFVFKSQRDAYKWCVMLNSVDPWRDAWRFIVIKVLPLSRGKKVNFVHGGVSTESLDNFYIERDGSEMHFASAPDGTYAHQSVRVLS